MSKRSFAFKIRKTHRYLGVFLGLQFMLWTVSGLYFSWTNINEIHGDQFLKNKPESSDFKNLISPSLLENNPLISKIDFREINHIPYYWVNNQTLYHAQTGKIKAGITKQEALIVAKRYMKDSMKVAGIVLIKEVDKQHEYREKLLPAYVISYLNGDAVKVYISEVDGNFQTVRHRTWRWFDFLWMTHTMDYEGRDNLNNIILRTFSFLGLITVMSGFLLWYVSSSSVRKLKRN